MPHVSEIAQRPDSHEYTDYVLGRVKASDNGYKITLVSNGMSAFLSRKECGDLVPKVGDTLRFYGPQYGSRRGVALNGDVLYYHTKAEDEAYRKTIIYGKDCVEVLARWDAGKTIWSASMGGLGPGYEQVIQLIAFEMLRYLVKTAPNVETFTDDEHKKLASDMDADLAWVEEKLGPSGNQWGAARNLATVFYRQGPVAAMTSLPEDRRMLVSKNFPSL